MLPNTLGLTGCDYSHLNSTMIARHRQNSCCICAWQTRRPVRHDVSSCAGSARGGTATCRHQSKLMHHVSEIKGKMLPTFGNIIIDIIFKCRSFQIHKINEGSRQSLPVLVFLLLKYHYPTKKLMGTISVSVSVSTLRLSLCL